MNRIVQPPYSKPDELNLIFPERVELQNGVQLFWFKEVKDESVKLDIEWSAGTKYQDSNLVAGFTNKLLLSGTDQWSSKEISEKIDFYGGFVQNELDKDHAGIVIYGLNEHIADIFNVVSKALNGCIFPEDEFEKERRVSLEKFRIDSEKVKVLCHRVFNQNVFGPDSKYGQIAKEKDFAKINRENILKFFKERYLGQNPVLFLTGNANEDFIEQLRDWSGQFPGVEDELKEMELHQRKGRVQIEKKGSIQSAIRIGRLLVNKKHPDYFGFQVLNTILGGYFGSRLMLNIREDKGYTYGIGSGVAVMRHGSYFFISTEVGVDEREAAINEIFNEIDRLKSELVPESELDKVKNYMLGEFLRNADGPIAMMENFKNIYFNDLSEEFYTDFIHAILDIRSDQLKDLANKYLVREEMLEITVG